MSLSSNLPLSGVRVLDFTRVLAGPFCTMLLGDLGADVIKIESFDGDETRQWGPPFDWRGRSAYYLSINRNKRGIALNLKTPEGQRIARALAAHAQVLVENFRAGAMASFGLDYQTLRTDSPALVYASVTGFGQTGMRADHPGYDFIIQAMSGLMSITGAPTGEPTKVGVAVSDVFTGLFAATSILAALRHAEATGVGQHLDITLLESQIAALVNIAGGALISGVTPGRYGSAHPSIVPYQPFHAADGMFALAVGNDRQFAALCRLIDRPAWASDARFATNPARVANRDRLVELLEAVFAEHPAAHWIGRCIEAGIPAGKINSVTQALQDPALRERGVIWSMGETAVVGNPVGFSATPPALRLPPPDLGEHTDAVLSDLLGMTPQEIAALRQSGVIV
ncbi:MAG: CoA transferase [Anaerolineae bacterium]|nr:CoA transferase [Anaerolineae bacterium]NUQ04016.1 CoA transferase [Anaerolineae bacterium]